MSDLAQQPRTTPRSGAALIKATAPYAVEQPVRSWFLSVTTALALAALWLTVLSAESLALALPCSLVLGLVVVRMFVIYHDHQHGAILRGSRLASLAMAVFGILVLAPSSVWRSSHDYHHRNNSRLRSAHIGSFPIMTTERWAAASRGERLRYRFIRHPLTIALAYPLAFVYGMCLGPFLRNPKRHWDGLVAIIVHLALGAAIVTTAGWTTWLLVQIVPHLLASAVGSYLFYAQHNFPSVSFFDEHGWTYHGAALESSSYMRMGAIMEWCTACIGYHHIHHLNARIPFYRLPEVMADFPELQAPKTTSLGLREIWRCLRLGLWDPERGRMVPYRDPSRSVSLALTPSTFG